MDKNSKSKPNSDLEEGMEPVAPDMTPDSINEDVAVSETGASSDDNLEEMSGMDAIVNEFLVESNENLDQLDQDLVDLEQNPTETGIIASIFRTIHTIKGTCGFIGFSKLESVAHVGESLLSKLREGELTINPPITSALLAMVDAIRQILSCIENSQNEGDVDYSELIGTLTSLQKGESVVTAVAASEAAPGLSKIKSTEEVSESLDEEEQSQPPAPLSQSPKSSVSEKQDDAESGVEKKQEGRGVADTNIRVDVKLLDRLMNLVGELVLARNQILQFNPNDQDSTYAATTQHLNLVTTELQEGVMKTRMQPIGNIWSKYPRVVRDLAASCGKKIRLEMEGKETELDKTLIEAIKDPLTHIVRNSADHGIETPEARKAAGKPEEGMLKLRAFHEGGQVNIEISDDGGGIDPERIKQKALEKNLITPERAARMSDRELVNLVFAPGFSTAAKITNVSGRGVGMDVVKTNIEKIGGTVDIQSTHGQGTTLKVKIPLTLAIIPALTITTGGDRYAIPQVNLLELVLLEGEQAKKNVEFIQGAPVYRLRGHLLPLIYLHEQLKVEKKEAKDTINIVVLQADDRQFGLVVEGVNDTEEIVVKPLSPQLKGIAAFSGATIMGDGKVALILDVIGLAQTAKVVTQNRERARVESSEKTQAAGSEKQTLLIFGIGKEGRMAIPLSMVARLEEFKRSDVERSGAQEVVQYRGEIMPLIYLSKIFNGNQDYAEKETMQAVVYTQNGKSVALVADKILDIVDEVITVQRGSNRKGTLGTVVVQDMVTDLLDAEAIVRENDPTFYEDQPLATVRIGN
ncbi:MAG: chemotaxis protein CheA [Nitrospinae bacterium]|jgi:two-component system, chemotaxis family, sensor kinase CheA|nr:chemotaxis protein CheA [Nitrospinota bacterium]MDA1108598.1 chemotaxis protein CheA [Nitrospinota bacterium]